ncbi:MAG: hypothetical protein IT493_15275 [Gammaproteobacteria bacterium]|nr:hypothetical protein [Gammaproteobacteria bacterium]
MATDERAAGDDTAGSDWEQMQQRFFAHCFGGDLPLPFASFQHFAERLGDAVSAANTESASTAAPWQSFALFGELLGEQARQLRASRRRKVDVATAMKALLESFMRSLDGLIAAQMLVAGDVTTGLPPSGFERGFVDRPALGLTRDWQMRLQRCWHALVAEPEAGAQLRMLQWRALRAGCLRCASALDRPGPAITNLRDLYDFFIDGIETAWHETAMTEEYARAFGTSVNALLALRRAVRELIQPVAGLLEFAGRAELDAIDRRLRDLEARAGAAQPGADAPRATSTVTAAPHRARRASPGKRATVKAAPRRGEFDIARMTGRDESE